MLDRARLVFEQKWLTTGERPRNQEDLLLVYCCYNK